MNLQASTKPPLVSVIIPAFNVAHVVRETLESVRAQTFQDFEVIINVDEGSTDDTAAVVRQFCEQDSRFILLTQPHTGISEGRNHALAHARGELIALLDADDFWLPEKLACQVALFHEDPQINLSFTNFYAWDGSRDLSLFFRDHKTLPAGDASRWLIFGNPFGTSTVMLRRELLLRAGLFDPEMKACEDWDLWLRMMDNGLNARGLRQPLMRYRVWTNNASHHKLRTARYDVRVLEKNLRLTKRAGLRPLYRHALARSQAKLELARARAQLDAEPEKVPAAIWRAWRFYPRKLKWLLWFALVSWPKFLGGNATQKMVHRKLIEKF